jgi:hypothetical protein
MNRSNRPRLYPWPQPASASAAGRDILGRRPVVTIVVTTVSLSRRKCVCRRFVRQRGHRILRPVFLPDPGW